MKTLFRGASRAAIILATTMPVVALAGTISGTVSDGTGTRALQSTQLRIVENGRIAEAGRDGSYRFPDVAPGRKLADHVAHLRVIKRRQGDSAVMRAHAPGRAEFRPGGY